VDGALVRVTTGRTDGNNLCSIPFPEQDSSYLPTHNVSILQRQSGRAADRVIWKRLTTKRESKEHLKAEEGAAAVP